MPGMPQPRWRDVDGRPGIVLCVCEKFKRSRKAADKAKVGEVCACGHQKAMHKGGLCVGAGVRRRRAS